MCVCGDVSVWRCECLCWCLSRRAQMYVIPSSSNHGDKENSDDEDIHVREWIV